MDGPHLDDVLWAMSTFYHLVNFNIKSSKVGHAGLFHEVAQQLSDKLIAGLEFKRWV